MENWYEKSIKAVQLNGMAERTQEGYTRAVKKFPKKFLMKISGLPQQACMSV